jgi:hypothetical protein
MIEAQEVDKIFRDYLFKTEEVVDGKPVIEPIKVEGIGANFGFHPQRIEQHKKRIEEIITELPDKFNKSLGGGWSFLNACMTKDDEQWGEQINAEQLVCLGIAIGKIKYCMPKAMWNIMPGGVPYFYIVDK